jgi:hypothetical protein
MFKYFVTQMGTLFIQYFFVLNARENRTWLLFSDPKTHVRPANTLVHPKNRVWNPSSRLDVIVASLEKTVMFFLKRPLYFPVVYRMFFVVPVIR